MNRPRFENETIWLTQARIAELFQITPQNVTLHLKAIFAEGELSEGATCKESLQVRREGRREVTRRLRYSIQDALADLGKAEELGRIFGGFQRYLYQRRAAA